VRDELIAAAMAAADRLGIAVTDPVVLHERHGLIVELRPAPVVARVARTASIVRPDLELATQAVTFAAHLADLGAPVGRPLAPPAMSESGIVVTLWEFLESCGPVDPIAAGAALRAIHEHAVTFAGELRSFDPRREAVALCDVLAHSGFANEANVIMRAEKRLELPGDAKRQALHGDAHLANVIQTIRGPFRVDLEDACIGPREWDLACLEHRSVLVQTSDATVQSAFDGYGDHDRELIDALAAAVMLWITPWAVYADSLEGSLNEWTIRRLDWLRRFGDGMAPGR
jgi:aminoglycoside phosphotransferase (APT) family kinase protein